MNNNPSHGKQMAELHKQFNTCKEPYLSLAEIIALKDWLKQMYEYNLEMGHGINALFFSGQWKMFEDIYEARTNKNI